jgi:uncharacterized protein DUF4131
MRVFRYGERIRLLVKLKLPRKFRNPGAFEYQSYLAAYRVAALASAKAEDVEVLAGFSGNRLELWRTHSLGIKVVRHWEGDEFDLGGAKVDVLFPPRDWPVGLEPRNNDSMVLHLSYGETSVLIRRRRRKSRRAPHRHPAPATRRPLKSRTPRQRHFCRARNFGGGEAHICRDLGWLSHVFRPAQTRRTRPHPSRRGQRLPHGSTAPSPATSTATPSRRRYSAPIEILFGGFLIRRTYSRTRSNLHSNATFQGCETQSVSFALKGRGFQPRRIFFYK